MKIEDQYRDWISKQFHICLAIQKFLRWADSLSDLKEIRSSSDGYKVNSEALNSVCCCRYASDADMTVSVRGLNAGVKDILVWVILIRLINGNLNYCCLTCMWQLYFISWYLGCVLFRYLCLWFGLWLVVRKINILLAFMQIEQQWRTCLDVRVSE